MAKTIIYGTRDNPIENCSLPKQIEHWFREYGVKFDARHGTGYSNRKDMLEGCAETYRCFRALARVGLLQICDGYFDKWGNSVGAEVELPKTRDEFRLAMRTLLETSKKDQVSTDALVEQAGMHISWIDRDIMHTEERYGPLAKWVKQYGPLYKSDRRVARRYERLMNEHRAKRRFWMRRFRQLSPEQSYDVWFEAREVAAA